MNVLIVYAKAGGGHKSVAEALREGFRRYHPEVSVSLLDIVGEYAPFPINRFPAMYPMLTRGRGGAWKLLYRSTDGDLQARVLSRLWWPMMRHRIEKAASAYAVDMVVSVYPLLNRVLGMHLSRMGQIRPKFVVLVTDLGTAHALWVTEHADRYLVPTPMVHSRLLELGVPPEKVHLVGLPVDPRFLEECRDRMELRKELGLCLDCPVVLVVGGAEGMGQLERIMEAIDRQGTHGEFVVVVGRNRHLQKRLASRRWKVWVKILGFVDDMYRWMKAADLMLTKAGPSTISEALASGLPMVITGYLPGQEKANVDFVRSVGAGIYEPEPKRIAEVVNRLVSSGGVEILAEMKAKALAAGKRNSTKTSVDMLYRLIESKDVTAFAA